MADQTQRTASSGPSALKAPGKSVAGVLWTGGALTYLEQLCLASLRDAGVATALFAFEKPGGLPAGVALIRAEEIAPRGAAPPALYADYFRYRLLAKAPGMISASPDLIFLRAPAPKDGRLCFREPRGPDEAADAPRIRISPRLLALPTDSPALSALIAFTEDPAPIPPWTTGAARARLEDAAAAGAPIPAEGQAWGVWGARALSWFLAESDEAADAHPAAALFPLPFHERARLTERRGDLEDRITEETIAVTTYGDALRRDLSLREGGLPRYWSWLGGALRRHGVAPRDAPPPGAGAPPDHLWAARPAKGGAEVGTAPETATKTPATGATKTAAKTTAPTPRPPRAPRAPRKADPAGRVLIVTTMKNEGPFLLEWIAYHRAIGVTDFLVYTNDCDDGTDEFHDLLARKGIVAEHLDNPFRSMNGVKPQHAAYWNAQTRPVTAEANWIIPMDVDEFINIHAGAGRFQDMLDRVPEANMISMTWRLFGDGFAARYEEGFVTARLTHCAHERARKPHQAWGFKTAFRNLGLYRKFGVHRPKGLTDGAAERINWVDGNGRRMPDSYHEAGWRASKTTAGYGLVSLNHYSLRSAESYLVKRDRGRVNHVDRDQGLAYWFRMNHNSVRDRSILSKLPAARAEYARLVADPEIAAMQARCVAAHRAKIAALMKRPDYEALYRTVTSGRMQALSRMLDRFGNAIFDKGPEAVPEADLADADAAAAQARGAPEEIA